jgi:hypothetical protein
MREKGERGRGRKLFYFLWLFFLLRVLRVLRFKIHNQSFLTAEHAEYAEKGTEKNFFLSSFAFLAYFAVTFFILLLRPIADNNIGVLSVRKLCP